VRQIAVVAVPRDPALEISARLDVRQPGQARGRLRQDAIGMTRSGLGFGFVEVGTLTAHPQPGNPKPRMFRLSTDRALINRLGFNNRGSADAAPRLARPRSILAGVNLGKSKITPAEDAAEDYATSASRLAPHADYLVVNVSSPNTPGLRDLQSVERLRPILSQCGGGARDAGATAALVKIAPDPGRTST
jgi:dihydroorotate dehydrogenase